MPILFELIPAPETNWHPELLNIDQAAQKLWRGAQQRLWFSCQVVLVE
jgi:hypothetical protein